jgi:hypothetical protein
MKFFKLLASRRINTPQIIRAKAIAAKHIVAGWVSHQTSYTALLLDADNSLGQVETRNIRAASIAVGGQLILHLQNEAEDAELTDAVVASIQDVECLFNS